MFEKYSGKSRRIVFFARYEASQLGSEAIDPEHLLLAILREDPAILESILPRGQDISSLMRMAIEATMRGESKLDASIDLPLSARAKKVLDIAAREQEASGDQYITPKHLLLGIVLEEESIAARLLRDNAVTADSIRRMPVDAAGSLQRRKQSEAAQILDQLSVLIDVLIRRGVFSRQDLAEELASRYILPDIHATLNSLLAVLVRKGAINDFDRREIAGIAEL